MTPHKDTAKGSQPQSQRPKCYDVTSFIGLAIRRAAEKEKKA